MASCQRDQAPCLDNTVSPVETPTQRNETSWYTNDTSSQNGETIIYLREASEPGPADETFSSVIENANQVDLEQTNRRQTLDLVKEKHSHPSETPDPMKETRSFTSEETSTSTSGTSGRPGTRAQIDAMPTRTATHTESFGSVLDNIIESSRCLIHHSDVRLHISTYTERTALKTLTQYGSVLITGISGSGKSTIGYRLLSEIEQETSRIPLVLTSFRHWRHIPQSHTKKKFVVFIDNIFGSSNLVESQVENWGKLFLLMQPAVESGHIMLILSSRSEIFSQCKSRLRKYPIIRSMPHIPLETYQYSLRKTEKFKFIRRYCNKIAGLQKQDIDRLTTLDPPLGFPQCCVFISRNNAVQGKVMEFFLKPHEFIAEDIRILKECDQVGYLVLVLVILMNNSLNDKLLTKPSAEFKELIQHISDTCVSVNHPPTCGKIREKINHLSDVYLNNGTDVVSFQHQSIFDAVFIEASKENQHLLLQHCPANILLEFVSIKSSDPDIGIFVEEDMFSVLAQRITELMFTEDCSVVLDHQSLQHPTFVQMLCSFWTVDILCQLAQRQVSLEHLRLWAYSDNDKSPAKDALKKMTETSIFSYKNLVSLLIMKRLGTLARLIIPLIDKRMNLDENLMCAVFMQNLELVMMLVDKEASVTDQAVTVVCCANPASRDVTDIVIKIVTSNGQPIENPERKLSLAVQHGNIFAVEHLVQDILSRQRNREIFSDCLIQLMYQCGISDMCVPYVQSSSIPVVDILQVLLSVQGSDLLEMLISAAARHEESSSLKYLLPVLKEKSVSCNLSEALYGASMFGPTENVNLLLQSGAFSSKAMIAAAQSSECSSDKLRLLLDNLHGNGILNGHEITLTQLVNMEEDGNDPLHFAVATGNADNVRRLLNAGADMNTRNELGLTSYQLAAFTCNAEVIHPFLDILETYQTTFRCSVIHFVVGSLQQLTPANLRSKLTKILEFVSKPSQRQRKTIDLLIQHGIGITQLDENGRSAISVAAADGNAQMVKYLRSNGVRVDVADNNGRTALHEAARYGDLEMIESLCEMGGNTDAKDNARRSVLQEAAGSDVDSLQKVKYLIENQNSALDGISEIIMDAIHFDNVEIIQYLVDKVIKVDELLSMKMGIFFEACRLHSHNILEYVVNVCNVDVKEKSHTPLEALKGNTGLHFAVQTLSTRVEDVVHFLLDHGSEVNTKDREGNTVLLLAIQKMKDSKMDELEGLLYEMHLRMIKLLISNGADVNVKNHQNSSLLHMASQIRNPVSADLVELLLSKGADVDARDESGDTALHHAVRNGSSASYKLMEVLVDRGANVVAKNKDGKSPVDIILYRSGSLSRIKREEMGKLKIIFDRCSHIEGYNKDALAFGLWTNNWT